MKIKYKKAFGWMDISVKILDVFIIWKVRDVRIATAAVSKTKFEIKNEKEYHFSSTVKTVVLYDSYSWTWTKSMAKI